MGRPSDWMREVTGRAPMRSPGHPGHQRIMERRFWDKVAEGLLPTEAAVAVGVSPVKGDSMVPRCWRDVAVFVEPAQWALSVVRRA